MRVLITGGARRLGRAMARTYARAGFEVAVHYRQSEAPARALADELREQGHEAHLVHGDLGTSEGPAAVAAAIRELWGELDVLVNSAAAYEPCPIDDLDALRWDAMMSVNLRGPFLLTRALAPLLRESKAPGGGSILNLVDVSTDRPVPGFTHYTASKAGLVAVTRSLALELAPEVRVNAIAPGTVLPPESLSAGELARIVKTIPLRRVGTADDIAEAALFLTRSPYITGHVLAVDGGRSVGGPMEAG